MQLHPRHAGLGQAADPAREPAAAGEPLQGAEAADQGRECQDPLCNSGRAGGTCVVHAVMWENFDKVL